MKERWIALQLPPRLRGFTLLELTAVLAIVGVLALISFPVYTHYIVKTRRAQAVVALLDVALGMERYAVVRHSYAGATLAAVQVNAYTDSQAYQLQISQATDNNYQLQAIPQGAQLRDTACGTLGLNQSGQKTISESGNAADCW